MTGASVTAEPIDVNAVLTSLAHPRAGAQSIFLGVVRNHDPSVHGEVAALEYSAHPDAQVVLEGILHDSSGAQGVHQLSAVHRVGRLAVGETALVVAVAAEHRGQAQALCHGVVEAIKEQLPVWKKEILTDGSHAWVGWS
ncbi:MAG: molybdenum cofactor biosynthesis protein MoaE [Actinobacteria bacterium HGW-Actinobacteria-4]|nr:MAG: molybdenum cofactor biosynthesis protein MoaE [Actinobacteria bacterium HGW-Actinobacteria-4]